MDRIKISLKWGNQVEFLGHILQFQQMMETPEAYIRIISEDGTTKALVRKEDIILTEVID